MDLEYSSLFKGPLSYLATERDESTGSTIIKITESLSGSYDFASSDLVPSITGEEERLIMFENNLTTYKTNYLWVVGISMSMVYAFLLKVLFNACTKSFSKGDKVGYDKWAIMDITSAVATLIIFPIMANSPVEIYLDKSTKNTLDYIVSLLIILQLTRFYSFMLLVF